MITFTIGSLILVMATTDTEHLRAAKIAIEMASQGWTPEVFGGILGSIVLLGVIKLVLRRYLHDLL